jgi:hypothetical protein
LQQVIVVSAFYYAARTHNQYLVNVTQTHQAMRNDQCGFVLHQALYGSHHIAFGQGVQIGSRFVQNQDGGIL